MIQSKIPVKAANELRNSLGWVNPSDFTLDIVASSLGISIKETKIKGAEGRILMKGDTGIISINSDIDNQQRKNFIIAHEIGHFILHQDLLICFDTQKTLSEWHKKGPQETEANAFASELLMPSSHYIQKVKGRRLNIALIDEISSYFNVSMLATFLKYVTHGDFPLMVIYIENGIVKWKKCSTDFPFQYLQINSKVPVYTVAGDYFYQDSFESQPEKIDAIEWFPEDFEIEYKRDWKLWEQCYKVSGTGIVSCLWSF